MERFRKIFSNTGGLNIAEPVRFPGRAACICQPPVIFYLKLEHSLSLLTVRRFEKKLISALNRFSTRPLAPSFPRRQSSTELDQNMLECSMTNVCL